MPRQFKIIEAFDGGLNTLRGPRDIRDNELSVAQNISVDKIGRIRTVGSLIAHSEVPTQSAIPAPGSGLYVYSSDHWREASPTVIDLVPASAASDVQGEINSVGSWTSSITVSSVGDTDGGAVASNGTTYIMKVTSTGGYEVSVNSGAIPTIKGQEYIYSADISAGDATSIALNLGNDPITLVGLTHTSSSWVTKTIRFVANGSGVSTEFRILGDANEAVYFDKVSLTAVPALDIQGDWLALSDAANAQIDLYSDNADTFTSGDLDFGTVSSFTGASAGNIDFPTTSTLTDSQSSFLNNNIKAGKIYKISGCATTTANNTLIVVARVTAGTVHVRGTPFTIQAAEGGTVTLTEYNPASFHYVNDGLRASPVGGGIALRSKHYSFVDRVHFGEDLAGGSVYENWFLNDVGPVAPTDQFVETVDTDGDRNITGDVDAGAGFEIAVTSNASAGDWLAGTYEVASTFIYDDGQESNLYIPSTAQTFIVSDEDSLDIAVRAHNTGTSYNERISGARAYCRITLSDDSWKLLVDIDMKQGARATLSGSFNTWAEGATNSVIYSDGFDSFNLNVDTFESLTGRDPSTDVEIFASDNRYWDLSIIAGNRCFVAGVRYADAGGNVAHFADRILYSQVNGYDTFPVNNFIDVVRGDAEDYVALANWGDELLGFKQRHLHIINIGDPDPAGWSVGDKSPIKFRGVAHPAAIFRTPHGIAWCNEQGVWLYNGDEPISLLENRIDPGDWAAFFTDYTITGYHALTNQLILVRDTTGQGGSSQNETMFFDFDTRAWTEGKGVFDTSKVYTNFQTDWNQDLIIGEESSGTVTIKKWSDTPASVTVGNGIEYAFKSEDFGFPGQIKKISGISLLYKSSAAQTNPISYYTDGATTSPTNLTGNFSAVSVWTKLEIQPTPFNINEIRFRISNPTNTGTIETGPLTIAYRVLRAELG